MPVHSVELGHLVLLNVDIQDTGHESDTSLYIWLIPNYTTFKPSDFSIINTDGRSDFDREKKLTLRDVNDRKLHLRLNYVCARIVNTPWSYSDTVTGVTQIQEGPSESKFTAHTWSSIRQVCLLSYDLLDLPLLNMPPGTLGLVRLTSTTH